MKALFWDFDGTLIDTREKNYRVTQRIVQHVTGHDYRRFEFLQTFDNYKNGLPAAANWREIYKLYFGFDEEQIDYVGQLWTEFQLRDTTPTPLFSGIKNVVSRFCHLPMAIISQNSKASIYMQLEQNKIHNCFNQIIGFEQVNIRKQKPEPDGILLCLQNMNLKSDSTVFYFGDHETDVLLVNNTNDHLRLQKNPPKVISVGVFYGNDQRVTDWELQPEYHVNHVIELIPVIEQFKD